MPKPLLWTVGATLLVALAAWAEPDPALYLAPPSDAVVLFDGTSGDSFVTQLGAAAQVLDGALSIMPGKGDLVTREAYGFGQYHLEYRRPQGALSTVAVLGSLSFQSDRHHRLTAGRRST